MRKIERVYNSNGWLVEQYLYFHNDSTNTLDLMHKEIFEYNSSGLETKRENYFWKNNGLILMERVASVYNSNNLLQEQIIEQRDASSNIFGYYEKLNFDYYANNLLKEYTVYSYSNNQWKYYFKFYFEYDANNNLILSRYYNDYDNNSNQWLLYSETTFDYNIWNNQILTIRKNYSNGEWINNYKSESAYLGPNKLEISTDYNWNSSQSIWIPIYRTKNIWANDLIFETEYYYYDYQEQQLKLNNKNIYIYNAYGNLIKEEKYAVNNSNNFTLYNFAIFNYENNLLISFVSKSIEDFRGDTTYSYYAIFIENNENTFHYSGCFGYFTYDNLNSTNDNFTTNKDYKLEQNYPNPFNPATTIKFYSPIAANAKLTVYDAMGREVLVIMNDKIQSGWNVVKFNSDKLSSGIYLYKLEIIGYSIVKKMILLK